MKRHELEIEHRYKNRFVGRHIFKPTDATSVIGSARDADLRLLGDDVSGVHATLSFENESWYISDMGSEQGTWVNKRPIVSEPIQGVTTVNIGGHHLRMVPREIDAELFVLDVDTPGTQEQKYHQVVVRRHGLVIESLLLKPHQSFRFIKGGQVEVFEAPRDHHWVRREHRDVVIQQRLVSAAELAGTGKQVVRGLLDPESRRPLMMVLGAIGLIVAILMLAPIRPKNDLKEMKPQENQFTRVIFDAQKVKQMREKSTQARKTMAAKAPQAPPQQAQRAPSSLPAKGGGQAAKVVSRMKAAGLSQLIGRISSRASNSASNIRVQDGAAASDPSAGPALATPGALAKAGKGTGGSGAQFKINGVGTEGKAGGSGAYRGVAGLAVGNVGSASVGILEEETEVDGGLDREVIAQVIKSQLGHIRYCYERQLSANPELYGKVMVKFTIGGTGTVTTQSVGTTTLNNAMVEGCMLRRIAGWKFPEPKGGTTVLVTYPFLFKATN